MSFNVTVFWANTSHGFEGIDFPNVKIVCTVGLPTNIVDALQRGGRAIRTGDEHALFIIFYEPWALEISLEDYIDGNDANDPDRPRGNLKVNSQRRERVPYSSVRLVQWPTCLRQFYADYLNDKSATGALFSISCSISLLTEIYKYQHSTTPVNSAAIDTTTNSTCQTFYRVRSIKQPERNGKPTARPTALQQSFDPKLTGLYSITK